MAHGRTAKNMLTETKGTKGVFRSKVFLEFCSKTMLLENIIVFFASYFVKKLCFEYHSFVNTM